MKVRAKFKVFSITKIDQPKSVRQEDGSYKTEPGQLHSVKLQAVYSNDPNHENKKFWDASPGGTIEINCANPEALKHFDVGEEMYVDFTPCPK